MLSRRIQNLTESVIMKMVKYIQVLNNQGIDIKHLIQALKANGKKFQYKIYKAIPGGHSFERLDTQKANEIRMKVHDFLANVLHPERPITTVKALRKAAYRF